MTVRNWTTEPPQAAEDTSTTNGEDLIGFATGDGTTPYIWVERVTPETRLDVVEADLAIVEADLATAEADIATVEADLATKAVVRAFADETALIAASPPLAANEIAVYDVVP